MVSSDSFAGEAALIAGLALEGSRVGEGFRRAVISCDADIFLGGERVSIETTGRALGVFGANAGRTVRIALAADEGLGISVGSSWALGR